MTALDGSRPHVVTAAFEYFGGSWWSACTCGEEFYGSSDSEVRTAGQPHRDAGRLRVGGYDRERDEKRRLRREARRGQDQSKVEGRRSGMRK